jgi:tetratricopeptide (TPR) repeat protein
MINYTEKAISIAPNAADANLLLGRMFLSTNRPEKAIEYCNIAIKLDPNSIDTFAEATLRIGIAYFHLAHYEQAVEFIEKGLTVKPEMRKLYSNDLAASYAFLGRNNKAKKALEDWLEYYKNGAYPSFQEMYGWWKFKNDEVFDRLAIGLVKAGFPGDPSDYVKLVEENKLTVEEATELLEGHTTTGIMYGNQWWLESDKQGVIRQSYIMSGKKYSNKGKSWIDNDMFCNQIENFWGGYANCGVYYRNPEGDKDKKNEYLYVTYIGLIPLSIMD